ncbi:autotransporter-associated beta strand repeat-containing protein, partial [Stenotrophomonas maltophilia]|uniref:autotransporter-associated beta strand repeat-containing protein n=1 Tax=Stenotrophomonas maltophilia TaxID=40324 RepID=UPI00313DDB85
SGDNTYTGGTTINGGRALRIGNGGSTGSVRGDITNNGSLVYNLGATATWGELVSGKGGVTQDGSGTLVLSGCYT